MDYDLYTTDDRRYARVTQPDDGGSLSGSSYAGSDASHPFGHFPADIAKAGGMELLSQPSVEAESGTRIGTIPVLRRPHDLLVPTRHVLISSSSEISQEDVLGQEEDQISEIGGRNSSSIVTEEGGSTYEPIQAEYLLRQGQEDVADGTIETSPPSENGLGTSTLRHNDDTHSTSRKSQYRNLGSGMGAPDNDSSVSESTIQSRDIGRSSQAEVARRTSLRTGSDIPRRRSPPLERTRSNSVHSNRNFREIILPRWQPDAEVTYCPICRTQFSFFVRKHHCRRCGRVVCNACSPHRITIPYQFIVQPPPPVAVPSATPVSQSGTNMSSRVTGATSDFADRNGGMKVRLCNPCVPDPNPLPPQSQYLDVSGQVPKLYVNSRTRPYSLTEESMTGGSGRARGLSAASGLRPADRRPQQRSTSPYDRHTGTVVLNNGPSSPYSNIQSGRYPGNMPRAEPLRVQGSAPSLIGRSSHSPSSAHSSQSRGHASRHQSLSFTPGGSTSNPQPHYRSLLDIRNDQYTRTSASSNRPLPPVPHIREEDECPVCHRVLFSHTLPDFETGRAAHIMQCINEQIAFHSGNSSRPGAYTSESQPPPTYNTTDLSPSPPPHDLPGLQLPSPTPIANTPEARTAARERAHAAVVLRTTSSASSTPPARRTGMFVYRASEKDCVDDAECTICLEEFEVGASMARLECFCRFHKKCIQDWFVDHPGRCPVHQHDGYGL